MDAPTRWQRLDAEHWIHVVGMVGTTALVLWTLWVAVLGFAVGLAAAALVPAALAAVAGWLTSAWRRERPWSWWAWTVPTALAFLSGAAGLADPGPMTLAWLVVSGGLLLLLAHPDSRARIQPAPVAPPHRSGK
jgi:hypothetical protein